MIFPKLIFLKLFFKYWIRVSSCIPCAPRWAVRSAPRRSRLCTSREPEHLKINTNITPLFVSLIFRFQLFFLWSSYIDCSLHEKLNILGIEFLKFRDDFAFIETYMEHGKWEFWAINLEGWKIWKPDLFRLWTSAAGFEFFLAWRWKVALFFWGHRLRTALGFRRHFSLNFSAIVIFSKIKRFVFKTNFYGKLCS